MKKELRLTINGEPYETLVSPKTTLVQLLRNELELTGTKVACNSGTCGACTVIIDGKAVRSCSVLAVQANGREILTIEGLANGSELHPIQDAFIEHLGFQCGFCTPGMIMSAKALLDENPKPTEDQAKRAIWGNLCRCTGYVKIVESILAASQKLQGEASQA